MTKPKILCLHGAGTNARIFEAQTARLGLVIRKHFDLVFLEGPIECAAGPGVLPFFEGEEPFLRWHNEVDDEVKKQRAGPHAQQMERVRRLLVGAIREQGPFVGVLGFSQGAKTAMQLLLLQEEQGVEEAGSRIKFGVLICGTVPAEDLLVAHRAEGEERQGVVVRVPTVHAVAESDPWRAQSEQLPQYCDEATRRVFHYTGGHHLPHLAAQNQQLADLILDTYRAAEARA
ncbi:Serine hydrolase [Lasiodiplodia theobromae]|uniref:Esterase FUS5 n=2 Tax=Lasiodiplodia TaxID=66739 RepID=A0A5N5DAJ0_9PEZI|nr:Phospholipase carboxylesterase [Lasiodiplodia theobromae]KAB2574420.1 Esterase FUS5 [Lasiodiplodia theobromae]KAF4539304.1 Phospholipase carboxylesterase [Lasiodiplodia theobromae]KAF9638332.1 Serine hydrolase [Lasiodiplodia theobromae]KAK0628068.1 Esterase FUS5 [Lasiodiplodia hormozganensis]